MRVSGNVWRSGQTLCQCWLNKVTGPGYLRIDVGKPGTFLPGTVPLRSFIPQQAVYVSASFTAPVMSDCQVSQKQYPEHQHQHRISDQPVLGKECDKAKEQNRTEQVTTGIRPGCAGGHEMCRHAHKEWLQSLRTGHFAQNAQTKIRNTAMLPIDACCSD
jgi:hypothetical protein